MSHKNHKLFAKFKQFEFWMLKYFQGYVKGIKAVRAIENPHWKSPCLLRFFSIYKLNQDITISVCHVSFLNPTGFSVSIVIIDDVLDPKTADIIHRVYGCPSQTGDFRMLFIILTSTSYFISHANNLYFQTPWSTQRNHILWSENTIRI